MKNKKWIEKWEVEGSNGHKWVVAKDIEGNFGCSCPVWKFKRQECHHIKQVKANKGKNIFCHIGGGGIGFTNKPTYRLYRIHRPVYEPIENILKVPLVPVGNIDMEATICYMMLCYGFSMGEIREIRHIPRQWTAQGIINHIEICGKAEFAEEPTPNLPMKVEVI